MPQPAPGPPGAAPAASKQRSGRTEDGRRRVRAALAVAALDLFVAHGYEATTVDDIVEAAGVGRRTFFRYFRSKEEVVFPDHDERLAEVVRQLEAAGDGPPALEVVYRAAETVLEMYLAEPEVSLKRFALTRQVASLRDREIASIDRYQRVFARYLRGRYAGLEEGDLRAAVAASAVVATHNHVLRRWLRSGGELDAHAALRQALTFVGNAPQAPTGQGDAAAQPGEVVIGVVRTGASAESVRARLEQALRDLPTK